MFDDRSYSVSSPTALRRYISPNKSIAQVFESGRIELTIAEKGVFVRQNG